MSVDLARAAILHGDYIFAFLVVHRFGTAFREHIKFKTGRFGADGGYEIASEDYQAFLQCLQIVATSVSHLSFNNPFYPSIAYFAEADQMLQNAREGEMIDEQAYIKHWFNLKVRYLRMLSRCQLLFEPEALKDKPIDGEISGTLEQIEECLAKGYEPPDSFVLNDTRARVHILRETPTDIAFAEKYFKYASIARREMDSEDRLKFGEPSKLRRLRSETTRSLLQAVLSVHQHTSAEPRSDRIVLANQILNDLIREIGPDNTWHTRLLIAEVQRKIDSIAGHLQGNVAPNMQGIFSEDNEQSLRERIERRSNSYQEIFFAVEDMDAHRIALEQSAFLTRAPFQI